MFVSDIEVKLPLDLCRIATNTGDWQRGVNAEVRRVRDHKTDGEKCR